MYTLVGCCTYTICGILWDAALTLYVALTMCLRMAEGVLAEDIRWQYDDSNLEIGNDMFTTAHYGKVTSQMFMILCLLSVSRKHIATDV